MVRLCQLLFPRTRMLFQYWGKTLQKPWHIRKIAMNTCSPISYCIIRFDICLNKSSISCAGLICGPLHSWTMGRVSSWNIGPVHWVGCFCAGLQGSVQEHFAPVCALISGALSPATFLKLPQGLTEVHTQQLSPIALDSPFLSASRFGVSIPHLCHTTGQNKERRGVDRGEGGLFVCLQHSAKQMKITQH